MDNFPESWRFTLIAKGGKAPIGKDWQRKPLTWETAQQYYGKTYQRRQVSAVGLLSGESSGGVLLLDHDGESCDRLLAEWGELPPTWRVGAGRPGHYQLVYTVPEVYWSGIETRKYKTGATKQEYGKTVHEQVELRWNGCQSLVLGEHPESGNQYQWMDTDQPIAEAPLWLIERMLKPENQHTENKQRDWSNQQWGLEYLSAIDPTPLDWYTWRDCLLGGHAAGLSESEVRDWSARSASHTDKGFDQVWRHIKGQPGIGLGTLGWLAKQHGWQPKINTGVDPSVAINTHSKRDTASDTASECCGVATEREIKNFTEIQSSPVFVPGEVLPPDVADKLINDAALLNIDPVGIWQYLMPAIASLMGSDTQIDAKGFTVPNIIWSVLIQHSGGGKSRAKNVVMAPIDQWQQLATESFKRDYATWKSATQSKKNREDVYQPSAPTLRKYVFNVATPQALVKRLSEQENTGSILVRDELKGLFKSLDQFTGEGEGLDILLESWDGKGCAVDRVDIENSYYIPASRLSIGGGLQPGVFQRVFSDPDDSQGTLARFLLAVPQQLPVKRVIGYCQLADFLPPIYQWIMNTKWGTLKLSEEADQEFTRIYEGLGNEKCPNEATRAWMAKLSGQVLRICMPLHALECYCDRTRNTQVIQRDTLLRAYQLALYYKACFYALQGVVSTDISGVLLKIYNKVATAGEPLAMADLYRNINALRTQAKAEGVGIKDFTLNLCRQLQTLGKGKIIQIDGNEYFSSIANTSTLTAQNPDAASDTASVDLNTQPTPVLIQHSDDQMPQPGQATHDTDQNQHTVLPSVDANTHRNTDSDSVSASECWSVDSGSKNNGQFTPGDRVLTPEGWEGVVIDHNDFGWRVDGNTDSDRFLEDELTVIDQEV